MAQQCERGLKDEGLSQQKRVVRVTCSGTIFTAEALRLAAARCLTFLCYLSADVAGDKEDERNGGNQSND